MSNRLKFTKPVIATRAEAEAALGEISRLTLDRNAQQTELDTRLTEVRAQFEGVLEGINKSLTEKTQLLEAWAAANPDEFPAGRKSIDMTHGSLGYRTGMPKVQLLKGQKWDNVLGLLKTLFCGNYIRNKEEPAKDQLIAAASNGELNEANLRQLRLAIVQDETFFIEPKLAELDNRTSVTA
jgi:phage host-nuclease inhibitor protein Gam